MITIGTKIRFRPSGWGEGKEYPGVSVPEKVVGTVTEVYPRLCVVEADVCGVTIRESHEIRNGVLLDKSLEVVR